MNWTRKHSDGVDSKHRKEWRAGRSRYRITWRDQAYGVLVSPGYQCSVMILAPEIHKAMWDFVDRRRPTYRTFKAAKTACELHADPSYKPPRKVSKRKRKAPMKSCAQCSAKVHVRKASCDCGHKFPKKVKR
jgi:hypothetical protein